MKNKKLNLNELKVKSFVTDFENGEENTVKGGRGSSGFPACNPTNLARGCYSFQLCSLFDCP